MIEGRIKKTFLSVLGGRGIMAVRQLILVPVLLRSWGPDIYGQWLVLTAIPSFLAMSNLGLGTSAQMTIAMDMAGGKTDNVMKTLLTAITMIIGIGLVICATVFTLLPYFYKDDLGKVNMANPQLILFFLVLTLFIKMVAQPLGGLWTGVGRPSVSGNAGNICNIFELVLSVGVPLCGGNGMILALSLMLANLLWLVWFSLHSHSIIRDHQMRMEKPDWAIGKRIVFSGVGHQIGPLWQAILFQGSIVLANSVLGPIGAATWGSLRFLTRSGNQVLELVSQTIGPEFQLAFGKADLIQLRRLFAIGLILSIGFSASTAFGLISLGPWFFKYWAKGAMNVSFGIWLVMAGALIPFSIWWLAGEFQRATNRPWLLNLWGIFAASASVGVMWLIRGYGLIGFAFGSLIFEILMSSVILWVTLRTLEKSFIELIQLGITEIMITLKSVLRLRKLTTTDT